MERRDMHHWLSRLWGGRAELSDTTTSRKGSRNEWHLLTCIYKSTFSLSLFREQSSALTYVLFELTVDVVKQHRASVGGVVIALLLVFDPRLVRHERARPDLTVRVGIRAAHHSAFILKYLNPVV